MKTWLVIHTCLTLSGSHHYQSQHSPHGPSVIAIPLSRHRRHLQHPPTTTKLVDSHSTTHVDCFSIDEWELTRLQRAQMSIKLLYSYQLTNPKSLTLTKSARGRPIEAAPGFVRLRKDIQHSCSSKSVRCVMSDTSLHEGAVGVAYNDGVVIVDHGSRRQESNVLLNEFVMMFKTKMGYTIVEPAHMELAEPSIRDAFGSCVQQGASRVIISPFFLFPGRHWNQDIPLLAEAAASEYPGIPYLVTAPLGLHELLVDVMKDRIDYCLSHVDGKVDECAICTGTGKCKIKVQDSKT